MLPSESQTTLVSSWGVGGEKGARMKEPSKWQTQLSPDSLQ